MSSACWGEEEACCGNEIRRIGETGLFDELREENCEALKEYGVREIIALSPHCMNALKKEYGDLGIKVSHYSESLARLIGEGALKIEGKYEHKVAYHDPCFLGKQNGVFDEPRNVLRSIGGRERRSSAVRGRRRFVARGGRQDVLRGGGDEGARGTRRSALPMRRKWAPRS